MVFAGAVDGFPVGAGHGAANHGLVLSQLSGLMVNEKLERGERIGRKV